MTSILGPAHPQNNRGRWLGGMLIAMLMLQGCPLENVKPPFSGSSAGGQSGPAPEAVVPAGVTRTDCGPDPCREIVIAGDPEAVLPNNQKAPFRGYADPSLRYDARTGILWLSYSWLSVAIGDKSGGGKPTIDFVVRTHLAKSTDNGRSFTFVKEINTNTKETHSKTGEKGWMSHEVSALSQDAAGNWHMMWIDYLDPYGPKKHGPAIMSYTTANSPESLGSNSQAWIRGSGDSPVANVRYNLSRESAVQDCITFMEPTMFSHEGDDFLAVNCVIFKGKRRVDLEKMSLFKKVAGDYRYVGPLLDHEDAKAFGGERMEQGELALARDGSILLIATPQSEGARHFGCYVFEVESLDPPRIARNSDGSLVVRGFYTDSVSSHRGPGACTYDPNSETGVIVVRRDFVMNTKPIKMKFSMMATGVHP